MAVVTTLDDVRTVLIDGHYWYVGPDGWRHPAVMGAEGEVDPPTPPPADPPEPPAGETFTKAQADAQAAQARKDAEKALREKYGLSPEQVKALQDEKTAAEDAKKDEATKAREAADTEKAAAATERAEAQKERLAARVERALLAAKVNPDRLEYASGLVEVELDADAEAIKTAVDAFKEKTPEWFPSGDAPRPSALPGGPRPVPHPSTTGIAAGRERARQDREARKSNRPAFGEGLTVVGGS